MYSYIPRCYVPALKSEIYFAKQSEINLIVIVVFVGKVADFVHFFSMRKYWCGLETVVLIIRRLRVTLNYI